MSFHPQARGLTPFTRVYAKQWSRSGQPLHTQRSRVANPFTLHEYPWWSNLHRSTTIPYILPSNSSWIWIHNSSDTSQIHKSCIQLLTVWYCIVLLLPLLGSAYATQAAFACTYLRFPLLCSRVLTQPLLGFLHSGFRLSSLLVQLILAVQVGLPFFRLGGGWAPSLASILAAYAEVVSCITM